MLFRSRILADYLHLLRAWRKDYVPHSPEEAFHPRFVKEFDRLARINANVVRYMIIKQEEK